MKKLTAGIFTVLMALVSANGANAAIATQGYVDQEVGNLSTNLSNNYSTTTQMNEAIATAKSGAEATAAADATEKANKALADAKAYVSGELGVLSAGAAETLNKVTANEQAIEGLLDTVADMDEAYKAADTQIRTDFAAADTTLQGNINTLSGTVTAMDTAYKAADTTLQGNIDTLSGTVSDMDAAYKAADAALDTAVKAAQADATQALADATAKANKALEDAKKYADDEDQKIETTIGTVEDGKTVVQMIGEAKAAASSGASEALEAYKATNNAAVAAAQSAADKAQQEVDALETEVANNKSATDTAIENIIKTDGTIDTKVAASAATTKSAYEAADASLKSDLEGQIAAANTAASTAAGNAETNAKAYALEKANAALTAAVGYTDSLVGKLPNIARVPNTCSDATNYCTLTTNGTDFYWEVIKRATGETIENDAAPLVSVTEEKPEELK